MQNPRLTQKLLTQTSVGILPYVPIELFKNVYSFEKQRDTRRPPILKMPLLCWTELGKTLGDKNIIQVSYVGAEIN